jgi:hypothetical protein
MYGGVPSTVPASVTWMPVAKRSETPPVRSLGSESSASGRARPKSVTRTRPSSPMSTLLGLKSRCTSRCGGRAPPATLAAPVAETKTKIKTKPTRASVDAYLASRASPEQLADCKAIMAMCKRVTKQPPKMWGPSIVGYGSYHYRYESGHSGDACLTGFAVRGKELVVYLMADSPEQVKRLAKLGKHKMGKSCLYFKRLADLDAKVLESLIAASVADVQRRYPNTRDT